MQKLSKMASEIEKKNHHEHKYSVCFLSKESNNNIWMLQMQRKLFRPKFLQIILYTQGLPVAEKGAQNVPTTLINVK